MVPKVRGGVLVASFDLLDDGGDVVGIGQGWSRQMARGEGGESRS